MPGTKCYISRMQRVLLTFCLMAAFAAWHTQKAKPEKPVYNPGNDVTPPQAIFTPEPDYSADARRGKFKGVVVVSGYVGTDGRFHDAKVARSIGDAALDAKVLNSVKTWKFRPCTKNGTPVNCTMNMEVAINLD